MEEIKLRSININDKEKLFKWRNLTEINKFFFKSSISKFEHEKWFIKKISQSPATVYIAAVENTEIGVVQYEIEDIKGVAKISLYLVPSSQGKGLGKELLKLGVDQIKKDFPQIKQVKAEVLLDNIASMKIFELNSFKQKFITYELTL